MAVFLYRSQSFPLTTYSLRFCDQHSGLIARRLWVQLHLRSFFVCSVRMFSRRVTCIAAAGLAPSLTHPTFIHPTYATGLAENMQRSTSL